MCWCQVQSVPPGGGHRAGSARRAAVGCRGGRHRCELRPGPRGMRARRRWRCRIDAGSPLGWRGPRERHPGGSCGWRPPARRGRLAVHLACRWRPLGSSRPPAMPWRAGGRHTTRRSRTSRLHLVVSLCCARLRFCLGSVDPGEAVGDVGRGASESERLESGGNRRPVPACAVLLFERDEPPTRIFWLVFARAAAGSAREGHAPPCARVTARWPAVPRRSPRRPVRHACLCLRSLSTPR